ncbi:MAG: hypothetical protein JWN61_853 [Pseudonocardiales bacterium]|nr:hypothetical protein [Pseudonocardiales bacterium]
MANAKQSVLTLSPKKKCCRSSKRCKRCPVVVMKARKSLAADGHDVGSNPRLIQLTMAPDECKKMRKRLEKAITTAQKATSR